VVKEFATGSRSVNDRQELGVAAGRAAMRRTVRPLRNGARAGRLRDPANAADRFTGATQRTLRHRFFLACLSTIVIKLMKPDF
jgi:hypothetical protein